MMSIKKRFFWMIILLIVLIGGVFGFQAVKQHFIKQYFKHFALPAAVVSATPAVSANVQATVDTIATLAAANGVNVTTQTPGIVTAIDFTPGEVVKAGQLLVQLDDSVDQQTLKSLQAQTELARLNFERQKSLLTQHAASESDYDTAAATYQEDLAQVAQTQATIAQKHITAPFGGVIGICQLDLGQYVSAGTNFASLQDPTLLHVEFSLPQNVLPQLKVGQVVRVTSDSVPNQVFLATLLAIDSTVDPTTRNIQVEAALKNPDGLLYPGAFVNVAVEVGQPVKQILVPQTAVTYSLYGDTIFTLTPDGKNKAGQAQYKAKQNFVTTGDLQPGNQVIVLSGIQAGDMVVTSGQLKLTDGGVVTLNNTIDLTKPVSGEEYT